MAPSNENQQAWKSRYWHSTTEVPKCVNSQTILFHESVTKELSVLLCGHFCPLFVHPTGSYHRTTLYCMHKQALQRCPTLRRGTWSSQWCCIPTSPSFGRRCCQTSTSHLCVSKIPWPLQATQLQRAFLTTLYGQESPALSAALVTASLEVCTAIQTSLFL